MEVRIYDVDDERKEKYEEGALMTLFALVKKD